VSAPRALRLLAGPDALRLLRERGLRAEDVDVLPAASGGPKWLVLAGLDRLLFGDFLQRPRARPLHLVGASIGGWRLACLAQRDPVAALERAHQAYIEQRFPPRPPPGLVSATSAAILSTLLGPHGAGEVLSHPWMRLHLLTTACASLAASERPASQTAGLLLAAAANLVSRRGLGLQLRRVVFHNAGDDSPLAGLRDLATTHAPLTRANLEAALLASASIPLVMLGVRVPGGPPAVYRDGGLLDYHVDLDFAPGDGLVLFPHFYAHIVPGWFDQRLPWRRAPRARLRRTLILAPSPEFVARLPHGKIPDRDDFYQRRDGERIVAWRHVVDLSRRLADELHDLLATGRVAERVEPL
jgi:hypothetical protein